MDAAQLAGGDGDVARPHLGALRALLANPKLPAADRRRVLRIGLPAYQAWRETLTALLADGPTDRTELLTALVATTDAYKRVVDLDLVYDSPGEFLSRQAGQVKLSSTVLEEFLPVLMTARLVGQLPAELTAGPARALTALAVELSGRVVAATKDQDFALARQVTLSAAVDGQPAGDTRIAVPLVAAECKTNLDATMFASAAATGAALSRGVPDAAFFVVAEWLDMTPQKTAGTGIANVLVLRGRRPARADRLASRPAAERAEVREQYVEFLDAHPLRPAPLLRLLDAVAERLTEPDADPVQRGFF